MSIENTLQELGQLATLAGLLGGFAFAAVIELLSTERRNKVATATILVFTVTSLTFLIALLIFILAFAAIAELNAIPASLNNLAINGLLITFVAIFTLEAGVCLAGWIRSRLTGIVTTALSLISICLTAIVIFSVLRIFF